MTRGEDFNIKGKCRCCKKPKHAVGLYGYKTEKK